MTDKGVMATLVSPHGWDGRGPVPDEVSKAARRLAELRVKFFHQWTPGADSPFTTTEMDALFKASAIQAEWGRELHEAVQLLMVERDEMAAERDEMAAERDRYLAALEAVLDPGGRAASLGYDALTMLVNLWEAIERAEGEG